jgi:hypothetical protein
MTKWLLVLALIGAGCGGDPGMMGMDPPEAQGGAGGEEVITPQGGAGGALAGSGGAQAALGGAGGDHPGAGGSQAGGAPGAGGRQAEGGAPGAGGAPAAGGSSGAGGAPAQYPLCHNPQPKSAMACVHLDAKGFEVWRYKDGIKCATCRDAGNAEVSGCRLDSRTSPWLCVHACGDCAEQ